jgi:hypothetical protein
MGRENACLPERGCTLYEGSTINPADLKGDGLLGLMRRFDDVDWNAPGSPKPVRSEDEVCCSFLRNGAAEPLAAGRWVAINHHAGVITGYIDEWAISHTPFGPIDNTGAMVGKIDEFLPAPGLLPGDVGWVELDRRNPKRPEQ